VQFPQVHLYSFEGGSTGTLAGGEAAMQLSIEVRIDGLRIHKCEGGWVKRQEWEWDEVAIVIADAVGA
jgi:hypothetical protein